MIAKINNCMILNVVETDIIFLSYDEPNAEKNYHDLCKKAPWAKRIHGIKGSDTAHKACAELSETDNFITIDADNIINQDFLSQQINFGQHDSTKTVVSWSAKNIINNLEYGNGGIKCWPKEYVLSMRTHENANSDNLHAQVDFCWETEYLQQQKCFSEIHNNASPYQAWRAGFREGVKMSLDRGIKPTKEEFLKTHWKNLHRLYVWCMAGNDVKNGIYAVAGARYGVFQTMCNEGWDYINVRDFDYLTDMWNNIKLDSEELAYNFSITIGEELVNSLEMPIGITPFLPDQSKFFKTVYRSPTRYESPM